MAAKKRRKARKKQGKSRRGLTIFVIVALFIGITWGVIAIIPEILFPDEVQVPAIEGMEKSAAEQLLGSLGLHLSVEQEVFDNQIPAGYIVHQDPPSGRNVKQNRTIAVRVSRGPQIVEMPSVTGMTLREARLTLTQAGFVLGDEQDVFDDEAPLNTVIDQYPEPGIPVQMGTPVDLVINRGREVLASVEVPDFRGQQLSTVRGLLANLGLAEGNLWPEYSTIYGQGQIIEQNPPPGTTVEVGWTIDFVYSQGAPRQSVTVPDTPPEELERWAAESHWHNVEVTINVPEGPSQEVTILVIDDFGAREVYREVHDGGTRVVRTVQGRGDGATLQVYIGGRMFLNRPFKE